MILKRGDKSPEVADLQRFLNLQGEKLDADGNFGGMTEAAVKRFQAAHGLDADGRWGPDSIKARRSVENAIEPVLIKKVIIEPASAGLFKGTEVDKKNAAMLSKVSPVLQTRGMAFIDSAKADGVIVQIVQGLRTFAEQDALYAQGRTRPGKRVTNAKGGQSMHNYGLALDFAPVIDGKISWNEKHYPSFGKWADKAGLDWGGRWKRFVDLPHVEDTEGMKLKEIQALYRQGGLNAVWNRVK